MGWADLQGELSDAARRVAGLLRQAPASTPVVDSAWSVTELGAHLVSVPRRYRSLLLRPEPMPESLAALNEALIEQVGSSDVDELAELLVAEVDGLLRDLGDDGARSVPFFGMEHTAEGVGGILLGELLLHGLDLARTLGQPWTIGRASAVTIIRGLLPAAAPTVDPAAARRATGTYHLRIRHGDDWTIEVHDGGATVDRRKPQRADLHVSADPVAFLLVGYGRASRWRAPLTGRMVAWGRRPWLAARFSTLFRET